MTKSTASPKSEASTKTPVSSSAEPRISLDEFGANQSMRENRVEMLGAFVATEKAAGRLRDTESAYLNRYQKFAKRPA